MKPGRLIRELKKSFPSEETKRLRLFHVTEEPEIERKLLREWKYTKYYRTDISTLANEIYEAAQCLVDETGDTEKFEVLGIKLRNEEGERIIIVQDPERTLPSVEPSMEGLVNQLMNFVERAYTKLDENLSKQSEMTRDLMNSYHKKIASLEKREEILSDIVNQYREVYSDKEDRIRRDARIDRMIEVTCGYFAPAAAEKMLANGFISPETAAKIISAGKDISEEVSNQNEEPEQPKKEKAN